MTGVLLQVLPLHSSVSPQEQRRVFERPPGDARKVVLATNIAETSLTIEDVVYVVDSGKLKARTVLPALCCPRCVAHGLTHVCHVSTDATSISWHGLNGSRQLLAKSTMGAPLLGHLTCIEFVRYLLACLG